MADVNPNSHFGTFRAPLHGLHWWLLECSTGELTVKKAVQNVQKLKPAAGFVLTPLGRVGPGGPMRFSAPKQLPLDALESLHFVQL